MRITSGYLSKRIIKDYKIEGTRPTMDRVKESLFAIIKKDLDNATVLDLFSGSGALGIEAISNNAKICYFNDINRVCTNNINKYLELFNIKDKAVVTNLDYETFVKKTNTLFDIVFLDPPYKDKIIYTLINSLSKNLNEQALIVCEVSEKLSEIASYTIIKEKKYGDKYIYIYRKE